MRRSIQCAARDFSVCVPGAGMFEFLLVPEADCYAVRASELVYFNSPAT